MGCVSAKSMPSGLVMDDPPVALAKPRLGDKLFEKRDRCIDLFSKAVLVQIEKSLSQWSTRGKIKQAYDDGIFRLFIIEATPTTRLFLDRSIVNERLALTDEGPGGSGSVVLTGTVALTPPRIVELLQYAQTEELLTKPVSVQHGLGVYLQPIENTSAYGVWISWHKQHATIKPLNDPTPRKLRLNEGLLNTTIPIGPFSMEGR